MNREESEYRRCLPYDAMGDFSKFFTKSNEVKGNKEEKPGIASK